MEGIIIGSCNFSHFSPSPGPGDREGPGRGELVAFGWQFLFLVSMLDPLCFNPGTTSFSILLHMHTFIYQTFQHLLCAEPSHLLLWEIQKKSEQFKLLIYMALYCHQHVFINPVSLLKMLYVTWRIFRVEFSLRKFIKKKKVFSLCWNIHLFNT